MKCKCDVIKESGLWPKYKCVFCEVKEGTINVKDYLGSWNE